MTDKPPKTYSEEELRAEVIKAATLAGQIASAHREHNREVLAPGEDQGGLLLTLGQVERAVENAIGKALIQLFDDLRLPIATREEKQSTIAKLEEVMRLNATSRKFVVGVVTTVVAILSTALGGLMLWIITRGAIH